MKSKLLFVLILVIFTSCGDNLQPQEGYVNVTGGKVWYKVIGDGDKTPIILLHGGPGTPGYYLNPLAGLATDRPVVFFDQLGCGRSDHHTDTTLMTVTAFVEQLEQLQNELGIERFYLYGSSWGTMLGMDYYLRHPEHVEAMIFSSPLMSAKMWAQDADTLIKTLPDSIQKSIRTHVANKTFTSPEYLRSVEMYYDNFVTRTPSADIDSTWAGTNTDIYQYMWGPSEFTATGTLKNYDRIKELANIRVPVLFIAGEFDEARPSTVIYYQSLVPDSEFVLMQGAGHLTMQDNPQQDIAAIRNFIDGLE